MIHIIRAISKQKCCVRYEYSKLRSLNTRACMTNPSFLTSSKACGKNKISNNRSLGLGSIHRETRSIGAQAQAHVRYFSSAYSYGDSLLINHDRKQSLKASTFSSTLQLLESPLQLQTYNPQNIIRRTFTFTTSTLSSSSITTTKNQNDIEGQSQSNILDRNMMRNDLITYYMPKLNLRNTEKFLNDCFTFEMKSLKLPEISSSSASDTSSKSNDIPIAHVWMATFKCPLTGTEFHSGTFQQSVQSIMLKSKSKVKYIQENSLTYYRRKDDALRACQARIVDCLNASSDMEKKSERYCTEDTFQFDLNTNTSTQEVTNNFISEVNTVSTEHYDVTQTLNDCYQKLLQYTGFKFSNYGHFERGKDSDTKKYWIFDFTCPITHEKIWSGTIQPALTQKILEKNNILIHDGKTYYKEKKDAQRACAARVLDCIPIDMRTNKTGEEDFIIKHCLEDPIRLNLEPELQKMNAKKLENTPKRVLNFACNSYAKLLNYSEASKHFNDWLECENESFMTTQINDDGSSTQVPTEMYTCVFTCPVTKHKFYSGTASLLMDSNSTNDIMTKDGKVYFKDKKLAQRACAARVLDCIPQETRIKASGGEDKITKYCLEDPVVLNLEDEIQKLGKSSLLVKDRSFDGKDPVASNLEPILQGLLVNEMEKSNDTGSTAAAVAVVIDSIENNGGSGQDNEPLWSMSPKSVVNSRYQSIFKDALSSDCFINESKEVSLDAKNGATQTYWTSTFECPVTGKLYPAGTLKGLQKTAGSIPTMCNIDDKNYYHSVKNAEHAAAGRAYDSLSSTNFFSSFGFNDSWSLPQFCEEDPLSDIQEFYGDDYEEEYVIQAIPKVGESTDGAGSSQTSLELLLDTWAESYHSAGRNLKSQRSILDDKISSLVTDVMSMASSWCDRMESQRSVYLSEAEIHAKRLDLSKTKTSSINETPVTLYSCNAVLKALGNVNSKICDNDKNVVERLEESPEIWAGKIMRLMILTSSSSDDSAHCKPNIETFNQYIRCVHRPSQKETALAAETFLDNMISGKLFDNYQLPSPNTDTFNIVMRRWMSVPNEIVHRNVSQVFSKLETQMSSDDKELRPTKETFKVALQSFAQNSKESGIFDQVEASNWFDRMEKYALLYPDDNFDIDTEMFNSALPWDEDNISISNDYAKIYQNGFDGDQREKKMAMTYARNIEDWVHNMNTISKEEGKTSLAPDLRTHESVIQAWAKTGTEYGILRAEYWADLALKRYDINVRVETFAPIIAAWAQSGEEKGIERVQFWIDNTDNLSKLNPDLQPDGYMRSNLILAYQRYQSVSLSSHRARPSDNIKDEHVSVAKECYDHLTLLLETVKDGEYEAQLDSSPFNASIDAWNSALKSARDEEEMQYIVSKMLHVVKCFDDLIISNYKHKFNETKQYMIENIDDNNDDHENYEIDTNTLLRIHPEVLRLHNDSPAFYTKVINHLRRKDIDFNAEPYFHHVERILRHYEMHCELFGHGPIHQNTTQCISIYDEVLEWCQALQHPTQYGDAVRLAMFVLDKCKTHYEHKRLTANDVKHICLKVSDVIIHVIPRSNEKIYVLKKILNDMKELDILDTNFENMICSAFPEDTDISQIIKDASPKKKSRKGSVKRKRILKRRHRSA